MSIEPELYTLFEFYLKIITYLFVYRTELPEVNNHMKKFEISLDMILSKWFICLFCDILPIETVFRIWDILMYGNSAVIVRAAYMSILWHKSNILATKDFADLITLLKSFPNSKDFFDCHKFIIVSYHMKFFTKYYLTMKIQCNHFFMFF